MLVKKLFRDTFLYAIPTFVSKGLSFFMIPVYTRILSPEKYGVIDLITIIGSLVNLTIALEITQAIARIYPEVEDPKEKVKYSSTAFIFTLWVYLVFTILFILLKPFLYPLIFNYKEYEDIYTLASLTICINGVFYFLQNQLRWMLKTKEYSFCSTFFIISTFAFSLIFAVSLKMGLKGIFLGNLIGGLVGCLSGYIYSREAYSLQFCTRKLKEMLIFSSPLVPSGIGVFFSLYIDRIAVKSFLGLEELGLFGIAFRFASVISLIIAGFQGALTPLIYEHYEKAETPFELAKIFKLFVTFGLILLTFLSLFSKEILLIVTTSEYLDAWSIIALIGTSTFFSALYIFTPGIYLAKKTKFIAFLNLSVAVLNIVLNIILIPIIGLIGAAVATLMSNFILFLLYVFKSQTFYKIPYEWNKIIPVFLLFTVIMIGSLWLIDVLEPFHLPHLIIKFLITLVYVVILIKALFPKNEILKIKQFVFEKFF